MKKLLSLLAKNDYQFSSDFAVIMGISITIKELCASFVMSLLKAFDVLNWSRLSSHTMQPFIWWLNTSGTNLTLISYTLFNKSYSSL